MYTSLGEKLFFIDFTSILSKDRFCTVYQTFEVDPKTKELQKNNVVAKCISEENYEFYSAVNPHCESSNPFFCDYYLHEEPILTSNRERLFLLQLPGEILTSSSHSFSNDERIRLAKQLLSEIHNLHQNELRFMEFNLIHCGIDKEKNLFIWPAGCVVQQNQVEGLSPALRAHSPDKSTRGLRFRPISDNDTESKPYTLQVTDSDIIDTEVVASALLNLFGISHQQFSKVSHQTLQRLDNFRDLNINLDLGRLTREFILKMMSPKLTERPHFEKCIDYFTELHQIVNNPTRKSLKEAQLAAALLWARVKQDYPTTSWANPPISLLSKLKQTLGFETFFRLFTPLEFIEIIRRDKFTQPIYIGNALLTLFSPHENLVDIKLQNLVQLFIPLIQKSELSRFEENYFINKLVLYLQSEPHEARQMYLTSFLFILRKNGVFTFHYHFEKSATSSSELNFESLRVANTLLGPHYLHSTLSLFEIATIIFQASKSSEAKHSLTQGNRKLLKQWRNYVKQFPEAHYLSDLPVEALPTANRLLEKINQAFSHAQPFTSSFFRRSTRNENEFLETTLQLLESHMRPLSPNLGVT